MLADEVVQQRCFAGAEKTSDKCNGKSVHREKRRILTGRHEIMKYMKEGRGNFLDTINGTDGRKIICF
jgi:hypothetical protein